MVEVVATRTLHTAFSFGGWVMAVHPTGFTDTALQHCLDLLTTWDEALVYVTQH